MPIELRIGYASTVWDSSREYYSIKAAVKIPTQKSNQDSIAEKHQPHKQWPQENYSTSLQTQTNVQ